MKKNNQKGAISQQTLIAIIVGLIVIVVAVWMYVKWGPQDSLNFGNNMEATTTEIGTDENGVATNNGTRNNVAGSNNGPIAPAGTSSVDFNKDPWAAFENYRTFVKEGDASKQTPYVQYSSDVCTTKAACATLYTSIQNINKASYSNKWEDSRQIVYSTQIQRSDTPSLKTFTIKYAFFLRDAKGGVKFLGFKENSRSVTKVNTDATDSKLSADLELAMADLDKDAQLDSVEKCEGDASCVRTDPTKRDTDGDGYWDGVESKIK